MLQITRKAEIIKMPLASIQQAIQNPSVTALINSGYYIAAVIPVEEEGKPTIFVVLSPLKDNAFSLRWLILSQWLIAVALAAWFSLA